LAEDFKGENKMERKETLKQYLEGTMYTTNDWYMCSNLGLDKIYVKDFFREYGEKSPEEMWDFIIGNYYKFSQWAHRKNGDTLYITDFLNGVIL